MDISKLPTEFRGVQWDDGWEFDAPGVIYFPRNLMSYGYGGNTGCLDNLVEDICSYLAEGKPHDDRSLRRECEWRGWSMNGFRRCRAGRHVVFRVKWTVRDGELDWTVVSREETVGPTK